METERMEQIVDEDDGLGIAESGSDSKDNVFYMNATVLAYMGDAIYETYVRERVIAEGQVHANRLHQSAVRYVRAEGQAAALKAMFENLSQEEQALVKRARNKKVTSKAKNADIVTYKWATAFEALIGYLYLSGREDRLREVVKQAFAHIEG